MISQHDWNYWVNFKFDKNNIEKGIIIDIPEIEADMLRYLPSEWIFDEINNYVKLKLNELGINKF